MNNNSIQDYSELSEDYDELRYTSAQQKYLDSLRAKTVLKCLNPNKNMTILDVGTGTGSGIVFFSGLVKKMVGLDATPSMLEKAREKIKKFENDNVELVHGDASNMPFMDETFDNVISLNFIHLFVPHGIEQQKEFILEMERVCKSGGRVIVEFDNALFLALGNHYKDLPKMSEKMKVEKIVGTYMPKTGFLYDKGFFATQYFANLSKLPIFKRFAYKWIVEFRKKNKISGK